jgi:hypothetical protein
MSLHAWISEIVETARSVALAVAPLVAFFVLFQIFLLKLPKRQVVDILKGTLIAASGLFLFLLGVGVAFLPFGRAMGEVLGAMDNTVLLVVVGVVLGFSTAWGEPAVRILADQVEDASQGSIPSKLVLYAICIGVALWMGAGMLRIAYELPLLWLLAPGYLLAVGMIYFSKPDFVAIATDAGGVATGPLANTFLLALGLGISSAVGGQDPVLNGFGLVALIALAPITSVLVLGLVIQLKTRKRES